MVVDRVKLEKSGDISYIILLNIIIVLLYPCWANNMIACFEAILFKY